MEKASEEEADPAAAAKYHAALFEAYKSVSVQLQAERVYNRIYGTQVALLEHVSEKGSDGELYINLVRFYNQYLRRSNLPSYQMKDYIGFLKNMNLVDLVGTDDQQRVVITRFGIDFLSYIKGEYGAGYRFRAY